MLWVLLVANLVHGAFCLAWMAGLNRWAGPLPPALHADLQGRALLLPPMVGLAHLLGLGPLDSITLVRADLWASFLSGAGPVWLGLLGLLLAGTTVLFLTEEALPAWRWRRGRLTASWEVDPRLDASFQRVMRSYSRIAAKAPWGRLPRIRRLETNRPTAALHGLSSPLVLVSRGLMQRLDDRQLDAVVAHEIAHYMRGGNLRQLLIWLVRALQAPNPAALLLFRSLMEAEEFACDALAARATGRGASLASALLEIKEGYPAIQSGEGRRVQRARLEMMRRAASTSTLRRVRALLDGHDDRPSSGLLGWLAAGFLLIMLWSIG